MNKFKKLFFSRINFVCLLLLFNIIFGCLSCFASEQDVVVSKYVEYYKKIFAASNYEKYDKVTQEYGSRNVLSMTLPPNVDKKVMNMSYKKLVKPLLIPDYELVFEKVTMNQNKAHMIFRSKYNENVRLYATGIKENTEWKFDKSYIVVKDKDNNFDPLKSVSF